MSSNMTRFLFVALMAAVMLCGLATAGRSKKQEFLPDVIRADCEFASRLSNAQDSQMPLSDTPLPRLLPWAYVHGRMPPGCHVILNVFECRPDSEGSDHSSGRDITMSLLHAICAHGACLTQCPAWSLSGVFVRSHRHR
jgi:hypothetical protein